MTSNGHEETIKEVALEILSGWRATQLGRIEQDYNAAKQKVEDEVAEYKERIERLAND